MLAGHVYVIETEDNRVKIGISIKPYNRIKNIATAAGAKLTRIFVSKPLENYRQIETSLFEQFKEYRTVGEWFRIPFDTVCKAIDSPNCYEKPARTKKVRIKLDRHERLTKKEEEQKELYQARMLKFPLKDMVTSYCEKANSAGIYKYEVKQESVLAHFAKISLTKLDDAKRMVSGEIPTCDHLYCISSLLYSELLERLPDKT